MVNLFSTLHYSEDVLGIVSTNHVPADTEIPWNTREARMDAMFGLSAAQIQVMSI